MKHNLIILDDEFKKTEIYKDIGDYKNMTQLALSKKIPHWNIIYQKTRNLYKLQRISYLKNYCRDCDVDIMFLVRKDIFVNSWRHYPIKKTSKDEFWDFYTEQFKILLDDAFDYFMTTKIDNEEVQCFCGGHYQATNKGKHYKTKKHLKCQTV